MNLTELEAKARAANKTYLSVDKQAEVEYTYRISTQPSVVLDLIRRLRVAEGYLDEIRQKGARAAAEIATEALQELRRGG